MVCGILFTLVESLQGNDISALRHLDIVIRLLNEASNSAASQHGTIVTSLDDEVRELAEHLDLEASLASISRPPLLRLNSSYSGL